MAQTEEGGRRRRVLGYCMAGAFFGCSEGIAIAKKSKNNKGKKKNRKGYKGNEDEVKNPSDGIYSAAGIMISSDHLGSQCG